MTLTFDLSDVTRFSRNLEAFEKQIPFALAQTLNTAAKVTKERLATETWPSHVQQRNMAFIKAALSTRGTLASKRNLRVEIYDRLGRGALALHDRGGSKTPRGAALAVPSRAIAERRGSKGVPKGMRPRNLPNTFVRGDVLYQRTGKYQKAGTRGAKKAGAEKGKGYDGRGLKLTYVLKPSTPVRADVPFSTDFAQMMSAEVRRAFPDAMRKAMKTAFRK